MSGSFGYELDPGKLSTQEKEEIRGQIERFFRHRDLIFYGDYYRLTNAMTDDDFTAWQFAAKDGSAALLNVVVAPKANPYPIHVWLKGLEPEGMYRETESDHVLGLGRYFDREKLLGVFNFGEKAAGIRLPLGKAENLLTGVPCGDIVSIPARDFVWLHQEV